jgi:hypothetical protein
LPAPTANSSQPVGSATTPMPSNRIGLRSAKRPRG